MPIQERLHRIFSQRKPASTAPRTQLTGKPALETLELREVPSAVAETGPNDYRYQATPLALTESPTNYLSALGTGALTAKDVDYWRFNAQAGDRISISGAGGANGNSVRLELRNSSDVVLTSATDSAGHAQIGNFLVPATGTYLIRATTQDGVSVLSSYSVRADVARGFTTETGSKGTATTAPAGAAAVTAPTGTNETAATANAIQMTPTGNRTIGLVAGSIDTATDVDYYDLGNQVAGATISLSVTKPAVSMLDAKIELRNSAGTVLATATGDGAIHFRVAAAGQYYAVVTANTPSTAGIQATYLLKTEVGAAVSMTIKAGNWSDPTIWNVPPTKDRDVLILHDVVLDSGTARRVDVENGATVTLAGTLNAYGSVVVEDDSSLVGTYGALMFHVANDRTFVGNSVDGPNPLDMDDHTDTDIGLWGLMGSHVKLVGAEVTSWLDAMPTSTTGTALAYGGVALPTISATSATLSAVPVGWQVGDTLLLTALDGTSALATLKSINGTVVTYTVNGGGSFSATTVLVEGQYARPKVANLTRRLVIAGADVKEGDTNHRAHTIFMESDVQLENVEFRNLGPTGELGRYPVHFHDVHSMGDMDHMGTDMNMDPMNEPMQELTGSSIWQSVTQGGNRFVTLHGAQGATISDNVAFRSQGHGFFMEDGTETGNMITGNLSVAVSGPETLPVTDSALAPGAHHYWLRAGNTVEGNVAVGGDATSVGMVLLPNRNPDTMGMPVMAVASDNQFLGLGKYAVWARGTPAEYVRTLSIYAGQSGVGDASYPDYSPITLTDPILLYNGIQPGNNYSSQIFMNQAQNVTVRGGLLVGATALHIHYTTTFTIEGTKIRSNFLMDPTYWEMTGTLKAVDLQVNTLFKSTYPSRRQAPGLVRIEDSTGRVATKTYTAASKLTADFTSNATPNVPSFIGTVLPGGARQLAAQISPTGFIRVPASVPRYSSTWSIVPAGAATGQFLNVIETEDNWKKSMTNGGLGYDGFPPGVYDIVIKTQDGRTLTYKNVVVTSKVVTDLATLTPAVKISSELSWATAFTPTVGAGGTVTINRTFVIQGAAPTSDFTISYYTSTDPYIKNNVTLRGTETVSAAADKTLGAHAGTSPVLKITTPGVYYVYAKIDTGSALAENDETNNTSPIVRIVVT